MPSYTKPPLDLSSASLLACSTPSSMVRGGLDLPLLVVACRQIRGYCVSSWQGWMQEVFCVIVDEPCVLAMATGDLFTALLLAWMHRHPCDLKTALEKAVAGLQAVLADTVEHCGDAAKATMRTAEVRQAFHVGTRPSQTWPGEGCSQGLRKQQPPDCRQCWLIQSIQLH